MQVLSSPDPSTASPPHKPTFRRQCSDAPAAIVRCGHAAPSAASRIRARGPPRHAEGRAQRCQIRSFNGGRRPDASTTADSRPEALPRPPAQRMRQAERLRLPSTAARDAASASEPAAAAVAADAAIDVRGTADLSDQVPADDPRPCLPPSPPSVLTEDAKDRANNTRLRGCSCEPPCGLRCADHADLQTVKQPTPWKKTINIWCFC